MLQDSFDETAYQKKVEELQTALQKGHASLAQVLMMPKDEIEALYATGLQMLSKEQNEEACSVFSTLTLYEPYDIRFWRALGLALQRTKRVSLSIKVLAAALCLDDSDIPSLTYQGEGFLLLNRRTQAKICFEKVIQSEQASLPEHAAFISRAQGLVRFCS